MRCTFSARRVWSPDLRFCSPTRGAARDRQSERQAKESFGGVGPLGVRYPKHGEVRCSAVHHTSVLILGGGMWYPVGGYVHSSMSGRVGV